MKRSRFSDEQVTRTLGEHQAIYRLLSCAANTMRVMGKVIQSSIAAVLGSTDCRGPGSSLFKSPIHAFWSFNRLLSDVRWVVPLVLVSSPIASIARSSCLKRAASLSVTHTTRVQPAEGTAMLAPPVT